MTSTEAREPLLLRQLMTREIHGRLRSVTRVTPRAAWQLYWSKLPTRFVYSLPSLLQSGSSRELQRSCLLGFSKDLYHLRKCSYSSGRRDLDPAHEPKTNLSQYPIAQKEIVNVTTSNCGTGRHLRGIHSARSSRSQSVHRILNQKAMNYYSKLTKNIPTCKFSNPTTVSSLRFQQSRFV